MIITIFYLNIVFKIPLCVGIPLSQLQVKQMDQQKAKMLRSSAFHAST